MSSAKVQPPISEEYSKSLSRVLSYPFVNHLVENAKGYYTTAKSTSPLVKNSCETVESTLTASVNWIVPKVQPIVHNQRVEPLLSSVDEFGVRQLERLEKIGDTVQHPVDSLKNVAVAAEQKLIVPVDAYLKDSMLATPINKALDVVEVIANRILPEEGEQKTTDSHHAEGPILRSAHLSLRCQKEVLLKMKNLSFRTPESINAMTYCVDLISYAQLNLDSGVKACNEVYETSLTRVKKFKQGISEQQKVHIKAAKERIAVVSHEALEALHSATLLLVNQIPANSAAITIPKARYEVLKKRISELKTRKEVAAFNQWCQNSVRKLAEANQSLSDYIQSNEKLPNQLTKVTELINSVIVGLQPYLTEKRKKQI